MKYTVHILSVLTILIPVLGLAQDGKGLFKAKCNVCHIEDKNSTGPILKNVKEKWEEAGELEFLYEWVKDPQALVASGKSEMAKIAEGLTAGSMNAQNVSNEEIDAILDYIDKFEPQEIANSKMSPGETVETKYIPNYHQNLNLFYGLICTALVLLFAIVILSGSMIRFVKSNYFKENVKEHDNHFIKTIAIVIGFSIFFSDDLYALEFMSTGQARDGAPWLLVENIDVYVMIILNLILLLVLFYVRRMMKIFLNMTKKPKEITEENHTLDVARKVNQILTDVVPLEDEGAILMHHEYDGIKELDNNLPPWWIWTFYGTIVFALIYMFNYHVLGTGNLQIKEYQNEIKQAKKELMEYRIANAMNINASNATLLTEEEDLQMGKTLYAKKCVLCHESKGQGNSGPNLTDEAWIYGYEIGDVFESIQKGRPAGGMPAHEAEFNPKQIQQIASFVLSLPYEKGQAPKGDLIQIKK